MRNKQSFKVSIKRVTTTIAAAMILAGATLPCPAGAADLTQSAPTVQTATPVIEGVEGFFGETPKPGTPAVAVPAAGVVEGVKGAVSGVPVVVVPGVVVPVVAKKDAVIVKTGAMQVVEEAYPVGMKGDLKRAEAYEAAYTAKGARLSPWSCKLVIQNTTNWAGLKKAPWTVNTPIELAKFLPTVAWALYKQVAISGEPQNWQAVMTPRDAKMAGFGAMTISATPGKITSVEYGKAGWF